LKSNHEMKNEFKKEINGAAITGAYFIGNMFRPCKMTMEMVISSF